MKLYNLACLVCLEESGRARSGPVRGRELRSGPVRSGLLRGHALTLFIFGLIPFGQVLAAKD